MVDVQPFHDNLDKLFAYMEFYVERSAWLQKMFDLQARIDEWYIENGMLFPCPYQRWVNLRPEISFDQWLILNKK